MPKFVMGKKAVIEQLKSGNAISVHAISIFPEIYNKCKEYNIEYILHEDDSFFKKINTNHQGVICYIKNNDFITEDYNKFIERITLKEKNLIVMLDELEDAGNVGSIFRTCDGFGIDGVILKKNNQHQINENTIKISQGSIYNSNILRVSNLSNIIDKLRKDGFWIISSALSDNSISLEKFSSPNKVCLVVGNEKKGVSKNILNKSDCILKIPMYGSTQSFNVSVATGILIYSILHFK